MAKSGLSYVVKPVDPAVGDMRPMAHATCAMCGVKGLVPIGGMTNNPEKIEKLFIRRDWEFDSFNESRCFCPQCVKKRANRQAAEREAERDRERRQATMGHRVIPAIPAISPLPPPPPEVPRGLKDAVTAGPQPKPTNGTAPMKIRDLSPAQKASLRTAIEAYFDVDKGQWTQGYNDHSVSEEAQVPRVLVEEFRESFYGPLKDDPVVRALQDEIAQAKRILANMQEVTLPKLERKLDEYRKKVGL